jgi:hypothetical protein
MYSPTPLLGYETLLVTPIIASVISDPFEVSPSDKYSGDTIVGQTEKEVGEHNRVGRGNVRDGLVETTSPSSAPKIYRPARQGTFEKSHALI